MSDVTNSIRQHHMVTRSLKASSSVCFFIRSSCSLSISCCWDDDISGADFIRSVCSSGPNSIPLRPWASTCCRKYLQYNMMYTVPAYSTSYNTVHTGRSANLQKCIICTNHTYFSCYLLRQWQHELSQDFLQERHYIYTVHVIIRCFHYAKYIYGNLPIKS